MSGEEHFPALGQWGQLLGEGLDEQRMTVDAGGPEELEWRGKMGIECTVPD
jgi:hypothetical protein